MNKAKIFFTFLSMLLLLVAGCNDARVIELAGPAQTLDGQLTIHMGAQVIQAGTEVALGTALNAQYDGDEDVSLTYRWYRVGDPAALRTGTAYTPTEPGEYRVVISATGYEDKPSGTIFVVNRNILGGVVTITGDGDAFTGMELVAGYDGDENVTYQWYKDGVPVDGATENTYTPEEAGVYTVVVSAEGYNSKASDPITVSDRPLEALEGEVTIDSDPEVLIGTELAADYSGNEPVNYQWYKDGNLIPGAIDDTYTPEDAGEYTVVVSLVGYESKTSSPVVVLLRDLEGEVKILGSTNVIVGRELTAEYSGGSEDVSYRWYRNGAPINGAVYMSYTPEDAGEYTVVVSADGYNSKISDPVTAAFNPLEGDILIRGVSGNTVIVGTLLTAEYTGSEEVTYQWYRDGAPINGAVRTAYTPGTPGEYRVAVSASGYDSKYSRTITAILNTLDGDVSIVGGVTETDAYVGTVLTAVYSGGETVTYQWYRDGNQIGTATGTMYTADEPGVYTVTVSADSYHSKSSGPVNVDHAPILPYHWYTSRGGPTGNYFELVNETELREFAKIVNGTARAEDGPNSPDRFDFNGKNVKLGADVVLSGEWIPVGAVGSHPFAGIFDGDGKKITVLQITGSITDRGLFHTLASTGVIRNLGVEGNVSGGNFVGGIVARNRGLIENSFFNGVVSGGNTVGGIVGYNYNNGRVENSYFLGSVSGSGSVGGIAGTNEGNVLNSYNGGSVSGSGSGVGGLAGTNRGTVGTSYNTGNVVGTADEVGGVVGAQVGGRVLNSYNTGNVSGVTNAGGIVGSNYGSGARVENCYNTGNIIATSNYAGGIAGDNDIGNLLKNSVSLGQLVTTSGDYVGRVAGGWSGDDSDLDSNKASIEMEIGESGRESTVTGGTANNENGANVAVHGTVAMSTVFSGWNSDIWNISGNLTQGQGLPTLKGAPQVQAPVLP